MDQREAVERAKRGDHDAFARPVFSPDGRRLAFLEANAVGAFDLVVTDPLGQARRAITTEPLTSVDLLTWSPDGASVVAIVPSGQVLFFDVSRTAPPRVLTDPGGAPVTITPTASGLHAQVMFRPPAGNEILFVRRSGASLGLYATAADGTGLRTIIDAATAGPAIASLEVPEWSPDGTRIVVSISALGEGDQRKLWIVSADGTGLRPLTQGPEARDEGHLQWSPDGTRVAFGRWIYATDGGVDVRPLTVVNVETGSETEIGEASNNGFNGWTWSPDGRSILSVPEATDQFLMLPIDPSARTGNAPELDQRWRAQLAAHRVRLNASSSHRPSHADPCSGQEEPRVVGPGVQGEGDVPGGGRDRSRVRRSVSQAGGSRSARRSSVARRRGDGCRRHERGRRGERLRLVEDVLHDRADPRDRGAVEVLTGTSAG